MDFTINYKGTNCRGTLYMYWCPRCEQEQEETHAAVESPTIVCSECGGSYHMHRKPVATSLDADHHDSMKSHNIGWDENA